MPKYLMTDLIDLKLSDVNAYLELRNLFTTKKRKHFDDKMRYPTVLYPVMLYNAFNYK
jgi:hypothetical protein